MKDLQFQQRFGCNYETGLIFLFFLLIFITSEHEKLISSCLLRMPFPTLLSEEKCETSLDVQ